MRRQRALETTIAILVTGGIALAGCGGDDDSSADVAGDGDGATEQCTGEADGDPTAVAPPGVVTVEEGCELAGLASITIIDVRTPAEYDEGHVPDAELVDLNSGSFPAEIGDYDRDAPYLVYCRTGNRSAQAAEIMRELGFEQVWDMGGIVDWEAAGYPVAT